MSVKTVASLLGRGGGRLPIKTLLLCVLLLMALLLGSNSVAVKLKGGVDQREVVGELPGGEDMRTTVDACVVGNASNQCLFEGSGRAGLWDWDFSGATQRMLEDLVAATACTEGRAGQRRYWRPAQGNGTVVGQCVPFPRDLSSPKEAASAYESPPDLSLVPMLARLDPPPIGAPHGPCPFIPADKALLRRAAVRHSPSAHSRWLLDEWRLWEGELCGNTAPDGAPPLQPFAEVNDSRSNRQSSTVAFATRSSIASAGEGPLSPVPDVYSLEHFCIDEEDGSFVGFSAAAGPYSDSDKQAMFRRPHGTTELYATQFYTYRYMLDPDQITIVPIAAPSFRDGEGRGTGGTW